MWFRRLLIKYKIWRLKGQLETLEQERIFYFLTIETRNIRFFDGKLDTFQMFEDYYKFQEFQRNKILENIKKLSLELN